MNARRRVLALAGVAAGLLAGCAAVAPPLGTVQTGRFAMTVESAQDKQRSSGRFTLTVADARMTLDLATPLGTTIAQIVKTADVARLTTAGADGVAARSLAGPDADALTTAVFGWTLPVNGFADWIEGRPVPSRPSRVIAGEQVGKNEGKEAGESAGFEQDGWTIVIEERYGDGRPRRLRFVRAAAPPAPGLELRIVVDEVGRQSPSDRVIGGRATRRPATTGPALTG